MIRPNQVSRIGRRPRWPMSAYKASAPVTARNTAAERGEGVPAVGREKGDAVHRADRLEHTRFRKDLPQPERRQGQKPGHHDRAEQRADPRRAAVLHQE